VQSAVFGSHAICCLQASPFQVSMQSWSVAHAGAAMQHLPGSQYVPGSQAVGPEFGPTVCVHEPFAHVSMVHLQPSSQLASVHAGPPPPAPVPPALVAVDVVEPPWPPCAPAPDPVPPAA
jgi:hypothetical protein